MSELYDAYYFAHGCGREYKRDAHWLGFFDKIAARITSDIAPKTVLDAGCAMGFLVETLRKRGVEAWGVDISDYAIQNVHPDIQPYCWVGSVTEPFPRKYDLIVTIEVLEHLPRLESEQALANLCQHTDDVLFSSTPLDYKEATHFNVQPVEYWAELFARQGFFRDVDFDASFITPWAARFVRKKWPLTRAVRDYERKFWLLWKENVETRQQLVADQHHLKNLHQEAKQLRARTQHLQQHILELQQEVRHWRAYWADMEQSTGWQLLHKTRLWQMRYAPPGSRRAAVLRSMLRAARVLLQEGPLAFVRRGFKKAKRTTKARLDIERLNAQAYQEWLARHTLSEQELARQREDAQALNYRPLVSVVTPVYNPPPDILRQTIDSVLAQTYDNWELCLVNGSPDATEVRAVLDEYAQQDARVRVTHLPENLGIAGNTNVALEMARGEFVQFLDHDDMLAPNALYEAVRRLNQNPATEIVYYDEDKLSEDGRQRRDPFFKPDWSPELLISVNYLTHALMRRSLVLEAGKLDPEMDGTQDWDLVLRCIERTDNIEHISTVLYHWRQVQGSTAGEFGAKSWVFERQLRAVANHLRRVGIDQAATSFAAPGYLRAIWPVSGAKVSIIIPTREKVDLLRKCITSITEITDYPAYEFVVVDNGSVEQQTLRYYEQLRHNSRVRMVEYLEHFNYSKANNLGAQHASGDIFLFLNNDIEALDADWLEEMVRWAERPEVGIVGAKLLYPDRTVQHAGVVIGMEGHASHVFWGATERQGGPFGSVDWYRNYSAVTGACMMMRREVFELLGGFDETYILAFSDIEICLRAINNGYRVVYTPYARLIHHEGKSRGNHIPKNDIQVGAEHFISFVEVGDPYFNPNLSYTSRMPLIAGSDEENRVARLRRIAEQKQP